MNQQMNTILFSAICACFGLQSSSAAAAVLIREAYAEPENAPRPPRNTDVIYYSLEPDAAPEPPKVYASENPSAASHMPSVSSFSAWRLQVVCYGPNALENARTIRMLLLLMAFSIKKTDHLFLAVSSLCPLINTIILMTLAFRLGFS